MGNTHTNLKIQLVITQLCTPIEHQVYVGGNQHHKSKMSMFLYKKIHPYSNSLTVLFIDEYFSVLVSLLVR